MSAATSGATVEWVTFTGQLHKFGPEQTSAGWHTSEGLSHRVALCDSNILTDEWTQRFVAQDSVCPACFPGRVA